MSEVPHSCGASLPVSVERFSGTRLRVMVGNGVPECEGNLLPHFKRTINKTVKLFKGQDTKGDRRPLCAVNLLLCRLHDHGGHRVMHRRTSKPQLGPNHS
ncbi:MAG: hypothetical protein NTU69_05150 [Proteobacteria bacterium]|nr:hypothetical protein [Pseudomonadota bacterium]